ncbi:MAG: YitT family protein [Oscillospiraceae bacterium]|nr:YitT family protein [Oscillospiraceae bacterium]MBQ3048751.1 YitT family protein [Oscillospiraceae bacterium]
MNKKKLSEKKPLKIAANLLLDILFDIIGAIGYSSGVIIFTAPNSIAPGGVSGLATIINHFFPTFPIGTISFIINVPLLIIALSLWGKKLTLKTLKSVAILSVITNLMSAYATPYKGNPLLAALFGGVCMGAGLAVVFLRGSTTGGTDIIGRLLQKFFPAMQTGRAILVIDFCVLLLSAIAYHNIETFLYGMVAMFTSSKVLDAILYGADTGKVVMIVSDKKEEIAKTIIAETGRGCTFLNGVGAYTNESRNITLCAVRKHQYLALKKIIFKIDPSAFCMSLGAEEIIGYGFKDHIKSTER